MNSELPSGIVAFLMTDVVQSTAIWRNVNGAAALIARQAEIIGAAIAAHHGFRPVDQGEGDSTFAAFARSTDAVAAASDAQCALAVEPWPEGARVAVRMAIHTGEA